MSNQQNSNNVVVETDNGFMCVTCGKVLRTRFGAVGHVNLSHRGIRPSKRDVDISRWNFTGNGINDDFISYLEKNISVGLEMEFDYKDEEVSHEVLRREFGVSPTSYHEIPSCPICGESGCWKHIPNNLIRAIERDGSIRGQEFIIYGNNLDSEDFVSRLPIEKMKQYFEITERDSMHVHILLVNQVQDIPILILKNFWQLFRYYYPAWVNLFGNTRSTYLRDSSYSEFNNYKISPTNDSTFRGIIGENREKGLNLKMVQLHKNKIRHLDVEIRTNDASFYIEQIVLARALSKALFVRASQLSNYGLISVDKNKVTWRKIKETIEQLNSRSSSMTIDENFLYDLTKSLFSDVSQFLTKYERDCFMNVMNKPVRNRRGSTTQSIDTKKNISETAKTIKRVIISVIQAQSKDEWITKVSVFFKITKEEVVKAIEELDAYWDEDSKIMLVK